MHWREAVTDADSQYQRLHDGVLTDPEVVWPELRRYLCGSRNDGHNPRVVDLIEDLMWWHSDAFVERLEGLVTECLGLAESVVVAHVGGRATAGLQRFHELQERLKIELGGRDRSPATE